MLLTGMENVNHIQLEYLNVHSSLMMKNKAVNITNFKVYSFMSNNYSYLFSCFKIMLIQTLLGKVTQNLDSPSQQDAAEGLQGLLNGLLEGIPVSKHFIIQ